jgi:hypothetical protein
MVNSLVHSFEKQGTSTTTDFTRYSFDRAFNFYQLFGSQGRNESEQSFGLSTSSYTVKSAVSQSALLSRTVRSIVRLLFGLDATCCFSDPFSPPLLVGHVELSPTNSSTALVLPPLHLLQLVLLYTSSQYTVSVSI